MQMCAYPAELRELGGQPLQENRADIQILKAVPQVLTSVNL